MKILITGSSGFIGSNLVQSLRKNHEVTGLDIIPSKFTNIVVDCKSYDQLKNISGLRDVQLVIDCAARTDLDGKRLLDYIDNFQIIKTLIKLQKEFKFQLIGFSSMLVNSLPIDNKNFSFDIYSPPNPYGESKMIYEYILSSSSDNYIIVRPTSIWGPGFKEPYKNFFNLTLKGYFFLSRKEVTKTFCYIENLLQQINFLISEYDNLNRKKFFIADGHYSLLQWAKTIRKQTKKSERIMIVPLFLLKILGLLGDFLSLFRIKIPLTSFRVNNLITDNLVPLKYSLSQFQEEIISLEEGVKRTINREFS